jgi:hypothetical protein
MHVKHFVKVHFDRRASRIDQAWLDARYKLFGEYTYASLMSQDNQDFTLWFCCDSGMKDMVEGLKKYKGVFTFGDELPDAGDCDYVYATRIDSDDLYARDALALARAVTPDGVCASMFRRGYMHDIRNGRLGIYCNPSSPFHTLMVPRSIWNLRDYRALDYGDHSRVASEFKTIGLPDYKFCVLVHGSNFTTTFDYSREEHAYNEAGWTIDRFIAQPIVFDVDDFCDEWNCLEELATLKGQYPSFKCTLFTIPERTSSKLLGIVPDYVELGVHGFKHQPLNETQVLTKQEMTEKLRALPSRYAKVFRPPGWFLSSAIVDACNDAGYAGAIHVRDRSKAHYFHYGHYMCEERLPSAHFHTHDVCGNYLKSCLPELLKRWPRHQQFSFASEAVCV